MYDIFFISTGLISPNDWKQFRERFPAAQKVENVQSIDDIKKKSFTKFFWIVWDDTVVDSSFNFDYRVDVWDEEYIHVFKHRCQGVESYISGIALIPKKANILKKEFDFRFYINKKEIDIVASSYKTYDIFEFSNYNDYLSAKEKSTTELFWLVPTDIIITDDFKFDLTFQFNNTYDRSTNHVFLNDKYYDGIILTSKNINISEREINHRFLINKKEYTIQASKPKQYDILYYDSYDDYLKGVVGLSSMVWLIPKEAKVLSKFKFDLYFSWHNAYDRNMNHVFLHTVGNDSVYNGIMLVPRDKLLTKREIDFRFPIDKKEYPVVASEIIADYDIVFVSYKEPTADENYKKLIDRFPKAKRIHGVKGIHQAHIEAAKIATTSMFWVVDGDAIVEDTFKFDHPVSRNERDIVHVWASKNPVNGLVYGYGGVKLLPRDLVLSMKTDTKDMTLGISQRFRSMSTVSNVTAFNTDPYNTWKSAFRECVKLASKVFDKDYDEQTDDRLAVWCTEGKDQQFGNYAIGGAQAGKQYGTSNLGNNKALSQINDFDWLETQFIEWQNNEQP
jgi:hypothetical protein